MRYYTVLKIFCFSGYVQFCLKITLFCLHRKTGTFLLHGCSYKLPAVYTKKNNKISMINRNAEYTVFEHIDFSESNYSNEYTFIRACKLRDKKTGEQVLFVAVPNRETNILAYSDSAHKADKTVTFGKFRIFCFIEPENNSYTDLLVDSEKIHLEKTKRKGMYFIGLDEVTKTDQKSKKVI